MPHTSNSKSMNSKKTTNHSSNYNLKVTRQISNKRREIDKQKYHRYMSKPENREKRRKRSENYRLKKKEDLIILEDRNLYFQESRDYWKNKFMEQRELLLNNPEMRDVNEIYSDLDSDFE